LCSAASAGSFQHKLWVAEPDHVKCSRAAATALAENYVGLPIEWPASSPKRIRQVFIEPAPQSARSPSIALTKVASGSAVNVDRELKPSPQACLRPQ
jgi:hypothetical protein